MQTWPIWEVAMPRGFTEQEREQIRARLLSSGREYLVRYGLRKISVEELAAAAGISKGAFYLFYPSKESLFFALIEQSQQEFMARVFADPFPAGEDAQSSLRKLLQRAFRSWRDDPLLHSLGSGEYDLLLQRLPQSQVQAHLEGDEQFVAEFVARWHSAGKLRAIDPALLSALLRAMFFVSLHEHDFESQQYAQVIDLLCDLVAGYLTSERE